jgi:hypothetical protein
MEAGGPSTTACGLEEASWRWEPHGGGGRAFWGSACKRVVLCRCHLGGGGLVGMPGGLKKEFSAGVVLEAGGPHSHSLGQRTLNCFPLSSILMAHRLYRTSSTLKVNSLYRT